MRSSDLEDDIIDYRSANASLESRMRDGWRWYRKYRRVNRDPDTTETSILDESRTTRQTADSVEAAFAGEAEWVKFVALGGPREVFEGLCSRCEMATKI